MPPPPPFQARKQDWNGGPAPYNLDPFHLKISVEHKTNKNKNNNSKQINQQNKTKCELLKNYMDPAHAFGPTRALPSGAPYAGGEVIE